MEMNNHIKPMLAALLGMAGILAACSGAGEVQASLSGIAPGGHVVLAVNPDFSLQAAGDTLYNSYLRLPTGKEFPLTGILRVDGKAYRFLGSDSLRPVPIATLSTDSTGWACRYSYLHPGKDWEQPTYDDAAWRQGEGAFGTSGGNHPVHTAWGAEHIYVRRHIRVEKADLEDRDRALYVLCNSDDSLRLYCNGRPLLSKGFTRRLQSVRLTDEEKELIQDGDNVWAAYGHNTGGSALLDFGLYVEDKGYTNAQPAVMEAADVQATQVCYRFRCGVMELDVRLVSSVLSERRKELADWPVGFISYEVRATDGSRHKVEVLFDMDTEWLSGKKEAELQEEHGWVFARSGNFQWAIPTKGMMFRMGGGHVALSQRHDTARELSGVLVLGHENTRVFQYDGVTLPSYRDRREKRGLSDMILAVGRRYKELERECSRLDARWVNQAVADSDTALAARMLPAYRAFVASHRLVAAPDGSLFCFADTLGHVREAYRSFPVLQFFHRTDWMKGLLDPIFAYCEQGHWLKPYPPYDLGLYPVVNKQVSVEDCAAEVASDMLQMTAAVVAAEGDSAYAARHRELLLRWKGGRQ